MMVKAMSAIFLALAAYGFHTYFVEPMKVGIETLRDATDR